MTTHVEINGNIAHAPQINNVNLNTTYTIDEINRLCLRALRCPDSLHVKSRLKLDKDKLLYGSIKWLFQNPKYTSWRDGNDVCLLWIKGGAGKGKTMLSIGLVERLSPPDDESTIVTYFFCQYGDYELNTIEAIIKGLILQLVNQQVELNESLRRRWDTKKGRFDEDVTSWKALWDIFMEMLQRCRCHRVFIVVDALDECRDDGMTDFLRLIVRTGLDNPSKIKWILTSRPLDSAERELLLGSDQVQVSLELNLKHVFEAVKTYISSKVAELNQHHFYGLELRQKLETKLREKAEGTYLWVSLVCKRLENVPKDEVLARMSDFPPGLQPLYHRIFCELSKGEPVVTTRCFRLLKVMMLVYRPLKFVEVRSVTGFHDDEHALRRLVDRCASFVMMRGANVEFVHQSTRDCLDGEAGKNILDSYQRYEHGEILMSCLSYLTEELKVNLLGLPRPGLSREDIERVKDEKRLAQAHSLEYAASSWGKHLRHANKTASIVNALAEEGAVGLFLRTKMLEWLECLSLFNRLPNAIDTFNILIDEIHATGEKFVLSKFIHIRFCTRCYTLCVTTLPDDIKLAIQIYSSAPVFSPQGSAIRRVHLRKKPTWLRNIPQVELVWTDVIQTLTGHSASVNAVAFSPDGKLIVSGSSDQTIKIWDTTTGSLLRTLTAQMRSVNALAVSPNGMQVVSGDGMWHSEHGTIKLWNTATGNVQKVLDGITGRIISVAFSPDGKQVASGHGSWRSQGNITLWDTTTGKDPKTFFGHSSDVTVVIYLPDGKRIASGSGDKSIKLWNIESGTLLRTLTGHSSSINAIAISPDGQQIVSGSGDIWRSSNNTINLWDIPTGSLLKSLVSHSGPIRTVTFSPDGKLIASASGASGPTMVPSDNSITITDITTGAIRKTLNGHTDEVSSVVFSPDGKHIVSGSRDRTIKLWSITTRDLQQKQISHSHAVNTVVFSPDGKHVASSSGHPLNLGDNDIIIWNTATGNFRSRLIGHTYLVETMHFSSDSKQILSGSHDGTSRSWDVLSGRLEQTMTGHSATVASVAFSPNGKLLASGSEDKSVKLWDASTGNLQKTLLGHSESVRAVAFSPDGKQILTGSTDRTVKLWNTMTGKLLRTLSGHAGEVIAVCFSPDGKHVVSSATDNTIRLWDIASHLKASKFVGRTLNSRLRSIPWREIKTSHYVSTLKFSAGGGSIATNIGSFRLSQVKAELMTFWVENQWIRYGSLPVLFIPPDFFVRAFDAQEDQVAIGLENGRVLVFEIDRRKLHSQLAIKSW